MKRVLPAHVVAASAALGLALSDAVRVRVGLWPLALAAAIALLAPRSAGVVAAALVLVARRVVVG